MYVPAHTCTQKTQWKTSQGCIITKNLNSSMLCNMKFLFLYSMHLILFSILPTTIFILLKTWLSSGTTCSFKGWMFHSWPSTAWKRIWLQNIELSISLHPSPIMNDTLSHSLSNFLEKYDYSHPLPLRVRNFSLTMFSKMCSFFPYHFPLKWTHSGSKSVLGLADHSSFYIRLSTEHLG